MLREEKDNLRSELDARFQAHSADVEEHDAKLGVQTSRIIELESQVNTLEAENSSSKTQVDALENELKDALKKHEDYKKRIRAIGNEQ